MHSDIKDLQHKPGRLKLPTRLLRRLSQKISSLFKPEEVEVTFKIEGNTTRYTYTIVPDKQVA